MKLLVFPHSHFCEKARWALDYKCIPFEDKAILPGLHFFTVRKYASKTSVPVLLNGTEAIQGSSEIIDYLDFKYPTPSLTPEKTDERLQCIEIEKDMDERLGENIRRVLYFYLLSYPDFIRHCFTYPMPWMKTFVFRLMYPVLQKKIYKTYVISPAIVKRAKYAFDVAMDELEERLKSKQYLIGNRFSRLDLSVAAMLSLLTLPPEHPFPWRESPDPHVKELFEEYKNHPVSVWARKMYRDHRINQNHTNHT